MELTEEIERQLEEGIALRQHLKGAILTLMAIADQMAHALQRGNKIVLFGNGGSASDAQHIAAELVGRLYKDRDALPAIALTANTSVVTALANDYGYEDVFARQVRGLVRVGDVAVGISTSGNSPNVLLAIEAARQLGAVTVAFTGQGGRLRELVDYALALPSSDTPRLQEAHITAGHLICYLVEQAIFGGRPLLAEPALGSEPGRERP